MAMPKTIRTFACFLTVAGVLAIAASGIAGDSPNFVRITPADLAWRDVADGHGVQQATLLGDPSKPGIYVIRVRFPPHVMDVPHWHPNARYVTVLEGTWYSGTGDTFDLTRAVPLKPGSVMLHPAKATHWDGSGGAETVIVQIIGEGPATTTQVDSSKAFWLDVSH
jgi:quercetin dioxygenase-like cupin family protein